MCVIVIIYMFGVWKRVWRRVPMVTLKSEVVAILHTGRVRIANGWCQVHLSHVAADGSKQYSIEGAIMPFAPMIVLGKPPRIPPLHPPVSLNHSYASFLAETHLYAALRKLFNIPYSLWTWNDQEGRTQAEVLALFDKAIELAEAEERINGNLSSQPE